MINFDLKGKVAVVTGSTSGIGQAISLTLAQYGADIVINGFGNPDVIEEQRSTLEEKFGIKALYSGADMSKPKEIAAMMAMIEEKLGSIDILVNNVGIQHVDAIEDFPDEKWDLILAINLSSYFHTIKAAVPGMKNRGWGRIINNSSVHGLVASPYKTAYNASKHGVVGLTKTVAMELAEFGITCNAICPGAAATPLQKKQLPGLAENYGISEEEALKNVLLKEHAIKESISVSDLASFVLFLCTDACKTTTGTAIAIDGGWTAH